jgi:predicted nucleic acid-binding protein
VKRPGPPTAPTWCSASSPALDARQRFQLSYWDAAIIEASRAMGCTQVLSEDLSDGQDYGGVQVANPFR